MPIINYLDIPVTTSTGDTVTEEQVYKSIVVAAAENLWTISKSPERDLISATLVVRNKHTIVVSIPYSDKKFSVKYQSSINMKYSTSRGVTNAISKNAFPGSSVGGSSSEDIPKGAPLIHPFYNKWARNLVLRIQSELMKL